MSYKGLEGAHDPVVQHLGGNIKVGDPFTFCPTIWDYVIERFCISSVMDLGSGSGNAAEFFFRRGMRTVAIEGYGPSVVSSLFPAVQHDLTKGPVITRVDLVHCQEVVEHIEEKYLHNLINSLLCGRYILMTHAVPGQTGYHHVNLQSTDYWIKQMTSRDCSYLEEDSGRVRKLGQIAGANYMAETGLLFVNNRRI